MIATTLLLAVSVVGVETGWQPHEQGGLEYIIQIEPELLSALREGEALTSEIPAHVDGVRRYRIVVGKNPVPRIGATSPAPRASAAPSNPVPPTVEAPPLQPEVQMPAEETYAAPPPLSAQETLEPSQDAIPPAQNSFAPAAEETPAAEPALEPVEQPAPRYQFPNFDPPPVGPQTEPAPPIEPAINETEPPLLKETEADALQTAYKQAQAALETVALDDEAQTAEAATPATDNNPTWIGWTLALLALAASLGANCYLGWMWIDTRRRYQSLVYQRTAA